MMVDHAIAKDWPEFVFVEINACPDLLTQDGIQFGERRCDSAKDREGHLHLA